MKFGPVPLQQAEGKILVHHIAGPDGLKAYRKGKPLTSEDIAGLRLLGRDRIYVTELEPDDVNEDRAAVRVARAVMGEHLEPTKANVGRVNLRATRLGVLHVDIDRLARLNECEGITLATLASGSVVHSRDTIATVKIIPFAVPEDVLQTAEEIGRVGVPLIDLHVLEAREVSVILSGSHYARQRVLDAFGPALEKRVKALGSEIRSVDYLPLEDELGEGQLARILCEEVSNGSDLIILAGETAIMDRNDIVPQAVVQAGGEIVCYGAPVDPGNLLMLAYLEKVPILGAPGCARSPKTNVIDWVLPRLLAGEHLSRADIVKMGHGGLLEDTLQRPAPRNRQLGRA